MSRGLFVILDDPLHFTRERMTSEVQLSKILFVIAYVADIKKCY